MTEQELRQLVRDAIARRAGGDGLPAEPRPESGPPLHVSHGRFQLLRGGDDDGACVIEPAVRCNHCGYCLSYGH
jgi:hypothetical protein